VSTAITPAAGSEWERFRTGALPDTSWAGLQRAALIVAGAGIVLFAVTAGILLLTGGLEGYRQLFLSYLVGYQFWLSVGLGGLAVLMLQYVTGGAWGIKLRRTLESAAATIPLLVVLFIPIALGVHQIYPWTNPEKAEAEEKEPSADKTPRPQPETYSAHAQEPRAPTGQKAAYLNLPWFYVRMVVYFAIWLALAYSLIGWGTVLDREYNPRIRRYCESLSAPGLVLYGLTITFASIDWVMSLDPKWYSTIYPVLFGTSQILTGFAFAVMVLLLLSRYTPLADLLHAGSMRDLGSLMLAFVMIWAYMSFSQFLLIWVGNLPEETQWYMRRGREGWQYLVIFLAIFHFALPFFLLLLRDIKENVQRLLSLALLLLVMRGLDLFWWIEPAERRERSPFFWLLDVEACAAVGGIWMWWFLAQLRKRPLLPLNEPNLAEALHDE
jgi:hypothetical protein